MSERTRQQVGNFVLGPEIGRGSFANVYKGYDVTTHQPVAIKSVFRSKLKNKKLLENLEVEISILKTLQHPHIVLLLDCQRTQQHFHLFMEYCSLGDLSYFIRKRDQLVKTHPLINSILERFPSPAGSHGLNKIIVINFLKQLASLLQFLRDANLVHRDIKPQNLLLTYPCHSKQEFIDKHYSGMMWELPVLKIADFGFARILPSTSLAETLCGSPLYMAPEILRYEKYNAKLDLWSVGAVLYEMSVGHPPFKASNHVELLRKIEKTKDKISFPLASQVDEDVIRLICGLLKSNPTERMGFQEFFQDPLILSDLQSTNEPLETSNLDESLFISEYLPGKGHATDTDRELGDTRDRRVATQDKTVSPDDSLLMLNEAPVRKLENISQATTVNPVNVNVNPVNANANANVNVNPASTADANSESSLDKDYVVVEKRTVEVNALADELQSAGARAIAVNRTASTPVVRRYSSSSRSSSGTSNRRPSFNERRVSISISPTNALSKLLGVASTRLFGAQQISPYVLEAQGKPVQVSTYHPQFQATTAPAYNAGPALQMLNNVSNTQNITQPEDIEIVLTLELLATKAHAILLFAEIKFSQLLPLPPSSSSSPAHYSASAVDPGEKLPPQMVETICEEGILLYIKTLSMLSKLMKITTQWWSVNGAVKQPPARLISLVQWIRERYNTALDKLEFLKAQLNELHRQDPGTSSAGSKIIPEKLIFNRALEISRRAAEDELNNTRLSECELAYSTAIWMLELVLDDGDLDDSGSASRLDAEDATTVENFVESIGKRLNVLRKKLEQGHDMGESPSPV